MLHDNLLKYRVSRPDTLSDLVRQKLRRPEKFQGYDYAMDAAALHRSFSVLRPRLLRFAKLQLRNDAAADDAVQEALLAASEKAAQFQGEAAAATWIFAILKNKIIDEFRRRKRDPLANTTDPDSQELALDEAIAEQFDQRDHWVDAPAVWSDPAASLEQKHFWEVFELCLDALPSTPGRVFGMRELMDMETEEICKELDISASNCWVLLYRARLGLRDCLSRRWCGDSSC
jgi:RNA polymerase sigma-70 factor (ECF subfamily)